MIRSCRSERVCSPSAGDVEPLRQLRRVCGRAGRRRPRGLRVAPAGEVRALHPHPERDQAVEQQRAENDVQRLHGELEEIPRGREVAGRGKQRHAERERHEYTPPEPVQPDRPGARRPIGEPLHQRAPAPQEDDEGRGDDNHRQVERDSAEALAVVVRRGGHAVQGDDENQRHDERCKPAEGARNGAARCLVPAEVADRHAAAVEQPYQGGQDEEERGNHRAGIAERLRELRAVGRIPEHGGRGP